MIKLSILDQVPVASGISHREALQQTVKLAQAADAWGYTRYWIAEHHNSAGIASSSPEVLISTLGAHTSRIRLGSGGVLLPHYSAYKVAENFRMLEALYPGRIDLGIGRAPGGTPYTARALRGNRADIFEGLDFFPEQVSDLKRFLTDSVEPGHHFEGIKASPRIDTIPQLWMLGSSGQGGMYAAQNGAAFCFAQFINGSGGQQVVQRYYREFRPTEMGVVPQAMVAIAVVCADTEQEAERLASSRDLSILKLDKGERSESDGVPSPEEAAAYPYSESDRMRIRKNRDRMLVGDPEQVKRKLIKLAESYGTEEMMVITVTHDYAARLRSYELLAEVIELKAR
jgi:luciferase family oxidoreductase group 1